MNILRVCNSSLHDCNRVVCTIPGVVSSRGVIHVNNTQIQFFRKSSVSSISALSTNSTNDKLTSIISPATNVSVGEKKIVFPRNKSRVFGASRNIGEYTLIRRSNLILAATSRSEFNRFNNHRHFSDLSAPSTDLPLVQVTGIWKTLSESAPVDFSQNALMWLHSSTGLPWWATILIATWGIRTVITLPLALYQNCIFAKLENLKLEMNIIAKDLKNETNWAIYKFKWTETYARAVYNRSAKKQWQKLIERENCHPMKTGLLVIIQIPMWVILSTSIRNLCYMLPYRNESAHAIYLELTTGGFGWIMNLTEVDHSLIIPVTVGLLNLMIIEIQCMMRVKEPTRVQRYLANIFRLVAVVMIPVAAYVPAALSVYWTSSSAYGIVQNFIIMSPTVRRLARIPPTESDIDTPYRNLYQNFRHRIGLKDVSLQQRVKKL